MIQNLSHFFAYRCYTYKMMSRQPGQNWMSVVVILVLYIEEIVI